MTINIPAEVRQEIKFVAYEDELPKLLQWIKLHPFGFSTPYPNRWIQNIYFDTLNYKAYADNLAGISARTKLRYRWYGESLTPLSGRLELKCRRNFFGWKELFDIPERPYIEGASWKTIRNLLKKQLPSSGRILLDANPLVALMNRYSRQYFSTNDGVIRITVDKSQSVWDQRIKPYPNFTFKGNLARVVVVEVKFAKADADYASEVIQGLPLRVGRNSKYMSGMRAIIIP